ncbi:hypothetical protein D3C80_930210 [compost metagenome]
MVWAGHPGELIDTAYSQAPEYSLEAVSPMTVAGFAASSQSENSNLKDLYPRTANC